MSYIQRENYEIIKVFLKDKFEDEIIGEKAKYITLEITKFQKGIINLNIHKELIPNPRMFVEHFIEEVSKGIELEEYFIHFNGEKPLTISNVLNTIKTKYPILLD